MKSSRQPAALISKLSRRGFLRRALSGGAGAALGPAALALRSHAAQATTIGELDAVDLKAANFALNLEYLEAQYFVLGTTGQTLAAHGADTSGLGNAGSVTVKANPQVPFKTPFYQQLLAEITANELAHVGALRAAISAGGATPAAMPQIDLLNSFNTIMFNAGIAETFDPFVNEESFIFGGFILQDVILTAHLGSVPLVTDKGLLADIASLLAVEGQHAALLRSAIFSFQADTFPEYGFAYGDAAQALSDFREAIGDDTVNQDQGIANEDGTPNIIATDTNGFAFSRKRKQIKSIFYLDGPSGGGFFPNRINLA